ncbi:unnamed protein product [Pylaiella littoralis]
MPLAILSPSIGVCQRSISSHRRNIPRHRRGGFSCMEPMAPPHFTWSTLERTPEIRPDFLRVFEECWPTFMIKGHPGSGVDLCGLVDAWPGLQLVLIDTSTKTPTLAATMMLAPVAWTLPPDAPLPEDGWDRAIRDGLKQVKSDAPITAHIGLAVTVSMDYRRQGLSKVLLKRAVRQAHGLRVIIPVRPTHKSDSPLISITEYLAQTGPDDLSVDPWVRTHQQLGATILGVCPRAMTMTGTQKEWEQWCGPRQANGVFSGLLSPLTSDGEYVEPNVWVEHATQN